MWDLARVRPLSDHENRGIMLGHFMLPAIQIANINIGYKLYNIKL